MAREGVPLIVVQRQLGHSNLGITSVYLHGIDSGEIIETVHARPAPMIPVRVSLPVATPGRGAPLHPGPSRTGDEHPTGDLPVAFPERHLACKVWVVRRRLNVAIDVDRPRSDRMLSRPGAVPTQRPEGPGESP